MKTYKHLWEDFISEENMMLGIYTSSEGKRQREDVASVFEHPYEYLDQLRVYAEHFVNSDHQEIEIEDGISHKKRKIIIPDYCEQVVHHMVTNLLIPIFSKSLYEHSYGSIPGRGAHDAKHRIESWINKHPKHVKYVLKIDIHHFFNSISHKKLMKRLREIIKDDRFLEVVEEIISVQDKGLPLGFFTSQWLANWYLSKLDHYIKEELHVKYYVRYMDDMVIFHSNKKELHQIQKDIAWYLRTEMDLDMKDNWQVYRFSYIKKGEDLGRDLDFMGFRFYRNRTIIRKNIMYKCTRKASKIGKKDMATIYDCRQMLSYLGWIDATDTHHMYEEWVRPNVNFGKMKKHISKVDKIINEYRKKEVNEDAVEVWQKFFKHRAAAA